MATISKDDRPEPETLEIMRSRASDGTAWIAYQNHDLGHYDIGRLTFLKVGKGCTHTTAPGQAPDSASIGLGWRYKLAGIVNLETGAIEELEEGEFYESR